MELHDVKEHLQNHFSDGLVVVVGSGLSCAEGLPGMADLAKHLDNELKNGLDKDDEAIWQKVLALINCGTDLETALLKIQVSESLEKTITNVTHSYIRTHEEKIVREVIEQSRELRFSRLLRHLLKPNSGIPVITTNYDRLLEVAAERQGVGVNNTFSGKYVGQFDPRASKFGLARSVIQRAKKVFLKYADFVSIYKPHGSIDWFLVDNEPVCTSLSVNEDKLIITPGVNKFRGGYERPFDTHRELSNKAIDRASRFFIVGYGFNDDHLQVHLDREMRKGKPTIVLTCSISVEFRNYIQDKKNIWAVCSNGGSDGFTLFVGESEFHFAGPNIWDLEIFVREVLE